MSISTANVNFKYLTVPNILLKWVRKVKYVSFCWQRTKFDCSILFLRKNHHITKIKGGDPKLQVHHKLKLHCLRPSFKLSLMARMTSRISFVFTKTVAPFVSFPAFGPDKRFRGSYNTPRRNQHGPSLFSHPQTHIFFSDFVFTLLCDSTGKHVHSRSLVSLSNTLQISASIGHGSLEYGIISLKWTRLVEG